MRRRRTLDVWPAFADLMTVLAIVGIFTTLALDHDGEPEQLEAARNKRMFEAIAEAERVIREIDPGSGLLFGKDQSLQFGDDLVSFEINSVEPIWKKDSQERLRRFCEAISSQLEDIKINSMGMRSIFVFQIEGHTDSSLCPGEPDCNWRISSGRAAAFVAFMRQRLYCPGGEGWAFQSVGYADTKPIVDGAQPTRRIAVRLVPNYKAIISSFPPSHVTR